MKKTISILLSAIFLLSLTLGTSIAVMGENALTADKFTTTTGHTDMVVENSAAGVRLKSSGAYDDFSKRFTYNEPVLLNGLTLNVSDMNLTSTAWQRVGQGGTTILLHPVDNPNTGILIQMAFNVHGNFTGWVYDMLGNIYHGEQNGVELFWGPGIPGVPKKDLNFKLNKHETEDKYVLVVSTSKFGHILDGERDIESVKINIPTDKVAGLFGDGDDLLAKVAIVSYFQPEPGVVGESVVEISEISPVYVEPGTGGDEDDEDDEETTTLSDVSLVNKIGNGTVAATDKGLKLNSSGTFEFEEGFKLSKAYKADGFGAEFVEMNIGESSFERNGQGGLQITLASSKDAKKALIIEQHFNVYGNSTGKVSDTNGNVFYTTEESGLFWGNHSGCVPKNDFAFKLKKQSNGDYLLTLTTKSLGKIDDEGNLVDIGDYAIEVEIPAADFEAVFGEDAAIAMSFMPYYQKPALTPGESEMVLKAILGSIDGEAGDNGGDGGSGNGGSGNDGSGNGGGTTKPDKPTDTGETLPIAVIFLTISSMAIIVVLSKKRKLS